MGNRDYYAARQSGKLDRINRLSKHSPKKLCWLARLWHGLRLSSNRSSRELAERIAEHEYRGIK